METLALPVSNFAFGRYSVYSYENANYQSESKIHSEQKLMQPKENDQKGKQHLDEEDKNEMEPITIVEKPGVGVQEEGNGNKQVEEKTGKKKKKWKKLELSELGFNLSLFPRPVNNNLEIERDAAKLWAEIEQECEHNEEITAEYSDMVELEGNVKGQVKQLRRDRYRRVQKAHKQIKTKHCKSVLNNKGRKPLYINHRVYKMMELDIHRLCYMPSPKRDKIKVKRDVAKGNTVTPITNKFSATRSNNNYRPTPVQCLAHTIHKDNLPNDLDSALANLLMNLQHRDLTPEDYDLLLRLDEARVKPKTLSENKLQQFKTEIIESNDNLEVCPICMDLYEKGQERKYLPCKHSFHSNCIDSWLKNSSMNCPIDNLPIES